MNDEYFKLTHNIVVVVLIVLVIIFILVVSETAVEILQHFADELDEMGDQSQRTGREYTLVIQCLIASSQLVVIFVVGHDHAVAFPKEKRSALE